LVRARSSSAFSIAERALRSCALSSPALAGGFLSLAQVGLGGLCLAARLDPGRLRDLESAHRDGAGILGVERLVPRASFSALT
jgi:hypothetical protein